MFEYIKYKHINIMNTNPAIKIKRNHNSLVSVNIQRIKILNNESPIAIQFHKIKSFLCSRQLRDTARFLHWLYISLSTSDILNNLKNFQ